MAGAEWSKMSPDSSAQLRGPAGDCGCCDPDKDTWPETPCGKEKLQNGGSHEGQVGESLPQGFALEVRLTTQGTSLDQHAVSKTVAP